MDLTTERWREGKRREGDSEIDAESMTHVVKAWQAEQ